jgi:hypothetical protein
MHLTKLKAASVSVASQHMRPHYLSEQGKIRARLRVYSPQEEGRCDPSTERARRTLRIACPLIKTCVNAHQQAFDAGSNRDG